MKAFFDSSAFAKRFIEEPGSSRVEEICLNSKSIGLSILCLPEIISALNRRLREKSITFKQYNLVKKRLIEEIGDIEILNVTAEVISKAIILLEKNNLRTIDAIHIASATKWEPDLFISGDKKQIIAAKKSGLKTETIE